VENTGASPKKFLVPRMVAYVGKYIKGCDLCQRTNPFPEKPQGE